MGLNSSITVDARKLVLDPEDRTGLNSMLLSTTVMAHEDNKHMNFMKLEMFDIISRVDYHKAFCADGLYRRYIIFILMQRRTTLTDY